MGFQFHSNCEYKAIKVFFLHPMRMLDPKEKGDEESSKMALQCPDTGYNKITRTSGFRPGWYGTGTGDGEVIERRTSKLVMSLRCWGEADVALHLWEPYAWLRVRDHLIMYEYVGSSWETWSDRSHEEVRLNPRESFGMCLPKLKSPNIDPSSTYCRCFASPHETRKAKKVSMLPIVY